MTMQMQVIAVVIVTVPMQMDFLSDRAPDHVGAQPDQHQPNDEFGDGGDMLGKTDIHRENGRADDEQRNRMA